LLLPKARSNSGAKMLSYSTIKIWSNIPLETKNKPFWTLFTAEYKMCYLGNKNVLIFFFVRVHLTRCIDLIT